MQSFGSKVALNQAHGPHKRSPFGPTFEKSMPLTKAEVYSQLIKAGVREGFGVVPEYRIKPALETRKREIDLAWCVPHPNGNAGRPWLPVGVFEIEGHDVELRRMGTFRGIEKDADSLLAAGRFLYEHTSSSLMPAAAVILFQLAADGSTHNSPMVTARVDGCRKRFAQHAECLYAQHREHLPAGAMALAESQVILDDHLADRLGLLVAQAREVQAFLCDGNERATGSATA